VLLQRRIEEAAAAEEWECLNMPVNCYLLITTFFQVSHQFAVFLVTLAFYLI